MVSRKNRNRKNRNRKIFLKNKTQKNNKLAGNPFSKYEEIFHDMDAKMSLINLGIKNFDFKDFNIKQKDEASKLIDACRNLKTTSTTIVDHLCKRCLITEKNIPLIQKRIEQLDEFIKKFDRQTQKQIKKYGQIAVSTQRKFDKEDQSV
jgi:hypothetical protein